MGRLVQRDEDGERGAILLIAAASLTLLVFAAALAIDIGGRAQEQTNNQKIADLAALDAVRVLPTDPSAEALLSADRNGYASLKTPTITPVEGTWANGTFTPTSTSPNAVKVTITSVYHDFFGGGSPTLTGTAIAEDEGEAQFQIGSTLISISAFNSLLGPFGSSLSLTAVGYNGLLGTNVTLGALATQLGLLSANQILTSQVTVAQLFTAAASLLNSSGGSSGNLTALGATMASGTFNSNNKVTLGGVLGAATVGTGNGSALGTSVNLLSLLSGGLELANGEAAVSLPLTVSIPGVTTTSANITGIVPATPSGYGPPGNSATDSATNNQVTVALNVSLNVSVSPLLGLGSVVAVTLPMTVLLGSATGTLTNISCTSGATTPTSITISTAFSNLSIAVGSTAKVTALGGIVSSTLTGTISVPSNSVPATTVAYPANFNPGGNTPVPVNSNLGSPTANLTATGALSAAAPAIDLAVQNAVTAALPVLSTAAGNFLGVNVGNADLLGLAYQPPTCSFPRLVQ